MFGRRYFAGWHFGARFFGAGSGAGVVPETVRYFGRRFFGVEAFGAPYFGAHTTAPTPGTFVEGIPKFWHVPYLRRDWPITPESP